MAVHAQSFVSMQPGHPVWKTSRPKEEHNNATTDLSFANTGKFNIDSSLLSLPRCYALPLRQTHIPAQPHQLTGSLYGAQSATDDDALRRKTPAGTVDAAYDGRLPDAEIQGRAPKHLLLPAKGTSLQGDSGRRSRLWQNSSAHSMSYPHFTTVATNQPASIYQEPHHHHHHHHHQQGQSKLFQAYDRNHGAHQLPNIESHFGNQHLRRVQSVTSSQPRYFNVPIFNQPALWTPLGPPVSQDLGPYGPYWPDGTYCPYRPAAIEEPKINPIPPRRKRMPYPKPISNGLLSSEQSHYAASTMANGPLWAKNALPSVDRVTTRSHFVRSPLDNGLGFSALSLDPYLNGQPSITIPLACTNPQEAMQWAHIAYRELVQTILQAKQAYKKSIDQLGGSSGSPSKTNTAESTQSSLSTEQALNNHPHGYIIRKNATMAVDLLATVGSIGSPIGVEAMLLAGSLTYVLGEHLESLRWFSQILQVDASHVEATSNIAATYLALGQRFEAEQYWRRAIQLRPDYFEAAEHLVGLLCNDQRHKDAIDVIDFVQTSLRTSDESPRRQVHGQFIAAPHHARKLSLRNNTKPPEKNESIQDFNTDPQSSLSSSTTAAKGIKVFQNRYRIRDADVGRIIALIHAKANLLYGRDEHRKAAKTFEEAILLAVGLSHGTLQDLTAILKEGLSKTFPNQIAMSKQGDRGTLLLSPQQALNTSEICFGLQKDLPGIRHLAEPRVKQAAISVASNSLLSLAKIFQDGMSSKISKPAREREHGIGDIVVLYYLSLSLQASPSTANNVGILLATVQQPRRRSIERSPCADDEIKSLGVDPFSGTAFALMYYRYGLGLDSKHSHLYTNLGSLLKDMGQLQRAICMYEKAVQCDSKFDIALANLANAVKDQGKTGEAIKYYKKAVQANPKFAEAVCGLANALNSICDWTGRGGIILKNGYFDRWHVDENGRLVDSRKFEGNGSGWMKRVMDIVESQLPDGEAWGAGALSADERKKIHHSLRLANGECSAIYVRQTAVAIQQQWCALPYEGSRLIRLIERLTRRISWQWYQDKFILGRSKPMEAYFRPQVPVTMIGPTTPTVLPFHTFTFPMTAKQVRQISQRNALRVSFTGLKAPWLPMTVYEPPAPPKPYLKVAYVSSDFNNHPLAHLMQSVFGFHNRDRVKAYCYATTASDKSIHREKIEREAPVFYDVSGWPTERVVEQIVKDGIHILVNLNGYTRGAKNEIFASRPAPIQMAFMGFAGTLGAEWNDYLLADETAVPASTIRPYRSNVTVEDLLMDDNYGASNNDWVYSENIIYTRNSFFCCDHRQSARDEERTVTWEEELSRRWKMRKGLFPDIPDDAILLGNFNQLYKVDPTTFRTWLRILERLPNAYLWLLRFPDLGEAQLLKTAREWAGPSIASRILFTDVAPKETHILRSCVADLFLDTPECNAHTTAADCLWSGTPLLTLPRYEWKMCSRMAAGILRGALNWPDDADGEGEDAWRTLVAGSEEDYEAKAIMLGRGLKVEIGEDGVVRQSGRLMELRRLIWSHRWDCSLFDTRRWVRDLEDAYEEAWRRWVAGEGGDIWLKHLSGSWLDI